MRQIGVLIAITIILSLSVNKANAQRAGLGVRVGEPYGLSFKYYFSEASAFEAIVGGRALGSNITALYQRHIPAFAMEEFSWFYGGGLHFGFFETRRGQNWWEDSRTMGRPTFGIDAVLGLEFKTPALPISISADYKPAISIKGYPAFLYGDAAITFRYRL